MRKRIAALFVATAQSALAALPDTGCGTCLRVRLALGGFVLAAESALSRKLGLVVGDKIGVEYDSQLRCLERPEVTPDDMKDFMRQVRMSPTQFAAEYGYDERELEAFLEGRGLIPRLGKAFTPDVEMMAA